MSSALQHQELVAQSKDLCLQRSASPEPTPDREKYRPHEGEHGPRRLRVVLDNFNSFNMNGVFGSHYGTTGCDSRSVDYSANRKTGSTEPQAKGAGR